MRQEARDGLLDVGRETIDTFRDSHPSSRAPWSMRTLGSLVDIRTGKKDANFGSPDGCYPFFTCAKEISKCRSYSYDCDAILLAGNCDISNMFRYTGKFEAYQRTYILTNKNPELADLDFVWYCLKHNWVVVTLGKMLGAAIQYIKLGMIKDFEIPLPPLSEQRRIVGILSAYDDLIENNRKRIVLLEESARQLYKEWFVRLRFPGHERVPVEDGVPKGWKRRFLPDLIEINPAEARPKTDSILYVPMSALATDGMTVDLSESEHRETSTSVRFRNGDTLLARITPCLENGKTGFVDFLAEGEVACGSTEFIVLRGKTVSPAFVYCLARTEDFRETAIKSMVGSSGRQRVQPACFDEYPVLEPDRAVLKQFDRFAGPAFAQIATLRRESEKLAAARDALLPRLMKGRVA